MQTNFIIHINTCTLEVVKTAALAKRMYGLNLQRSKISLNPALFLIRLFSFGFLTLCRSRYTKDFNFIFII